MSVRVPFLSAAKEAEAIANANYDLLKEQTLRAVAGKLRAEGITTLNQPDLEEAYNRGWEAVVKHIEKGRPLDPLEGLLFSITHRRAQDLYRTKHEARHVDVDLEQHVVEVDVAEQLDDQQKLTKLLARLKDRLNEKERRAVTLCTLHGYSRPEAADHLGIDRIVFERIMDGATKKMGGIVASIEARGCGGDEWSRLMLAYARGLLAEDHADFRRAVDHIEGEEPCHSCRRYVNGLRGIAAVFPPVLPLGHVGLLPELVAWIKRVLRIGQSHGAASGTVGAAGGGSGAVSTVLSSGAVKVAAVAVIAAGAVGAGTSGIASHHHKSEAPVSFARDVPVDLVHGAPDDGFIKPRSDSSRASATSHHRPAGASARSSEFARTATTHKAQIATAREFSFEKASPEPPAPISVPVEHASSPDTARASSDNGKEFGFEKTP